MSPWADFFFKSFSWAAQNKSIKNDRKTICNKFLGRFKKNVQFYLLKKNRKFAKFYYLSFVIIHDTAKQKQKRHLAADWPTRAHLFFVLEMG